MREMIMYRKGEVNFQNLKVDFVLTENTSLVIQLLNLNSYSNTYFKA